MNKREPIACLWVDNPPLPDAVRNILIEKLCELKPGQKNMEFEIDSFRCDLSILEEGEFFCLGSSAAGLRCSIVVEGIEEWVTAHFLADVSLLSSKPMKKGALILPLY
ncbi:MAG: hypothetical protein HGA36_04680 [Candidatus Moranbacteria bacterium]|nr:hypothetical protein [Candidatus Moranbacteria bacterium]